METIKTEKRDTYFIGDIHGNLESITWEICDRYKIKDSDFIFCGDFGVGFGGENSMRDQYNKIEEKLKSSGNKYWVVRGNHDDPGWFDGMHNFPNLVFIPDHIPFNLNGKIIYPVGGGTSIDQAQRIKENESNIKYGSRKRCWWPGERVTKKYLGLPDKVDIVVSHEAPMDFEPIIIKEGDGILSSVIDGIVTDRNYLSWLLRELHPPRWFHGHYHFSTSGDYMGCLYRGLDIDEIFMLPI